MPRIRTSLLALVAGLCASVSVGTSAATAAPFAPALISTADQNAKIHLKDGRIIEGTIQREVNGYVWIKARIANVEQELTLRPEEIDKIDRLTGDAAPAADAPAKPEDAKDVVKDPGTKTSGAPKAVILTLGELPERNMVGLFTNAKPLMDAIPTLEEELGKDGSGVVILRLRTYGGMVIEINKLHKVILDELKPRFRTAGWIEIAISAGAATSQVLDELYFTTPGIYGAAVGFSSQGGVMKAMSGRSFEEFLFYMEQMSAKGGRAPEIFHAMQDTVPLSCTIDENGDVKWYQDETSGKFLVNPADKVLTFNSTDAIKYKFARAVVDDYRDLPKAMGYQELSFVGKKVNGYDWPVSKSEEIQLRYRGKVFDDQTKTNAYLTDYQGSIQQAQAAAEKADKAKFVGRARNALGSIKSMVKNNPNFALTIFSQLPEDWPTWIEEQEKILRDLMR